MTHFGKGEIYQQLLFLPDGDAWIGDRFLDLKKKAFSPDGRELFTCEQDGLVHRFDLNAGDVLATYATLSPVSGVTVSPDGRQMLVSGYGESLWDLASGNQLY